MKFKLDRCWGDSLISEDGITLGFNKIIEAVDNRTGRTVFVITKKTNYHEHGASGSYTSIEILDLENDMELNSDDFTKGFYLEVDVEN